MLQLPQSTWKNLVAIKALAKQIAASLAAVWTSENRLPVDTGSSANSVTVQDPTTPGNKIKINGSGEIFVANQPTGGATESTLTATQTSLETRIGGTTDAPATDHNSVSGMSGLIRLLIKLLFDGSNTASTSGTISQQLRFIGENSGGGTQYDSGSNPATPRGNLFLGRRSTGEIFPVEIDSSGYLKIAIAAGNNPAPTEYLEGSSPATLSGAVLLAKESDGTLTALKLDNAGALQISAQSAIPITASSPISVNVVSGGGGGGGIQYADGTTSATPTGTVALANKSGVTKALQLDANNYLQVTTPNLTNTQYVDNTTSATPTGSVVLANKSGVLKALQLDTNNYLQVATPNLTNVQYADGTTSATPTGTVALANKSGVAKALQLDTNNYLQVATPNLTNVQYAFETTNSTPTGNVVLGSKSGVLKPLLLDANENLKVVDVDSIAQLQVIQDKIGTVGAAANPNGTTTQQLRYIAEKIDRIPIVTAISITAGVGDVTVLGAVASQKIAITGLYFTLSNGAVTLKSDTTAITGAMAINEHAADYTHPLVLATNTAFVMNLSLTADVAGYVLWYLI
jgi:hypothetical protein